VRFEAVVFDLDGTLIDTMTSVPLAYAEAIRERGGPDLTPDQVVAAWHLGPTPAVLAHFLGRPVTDGDLACFHDRMAVAAESARPSRYFLGRPRR
jgi:beta-phosphoglucomutase-like phosphatase (HAD superfamily)